MVGSPYNSTRWIYWENGSPLGRCRLAGCPFTFPRLPLATLRYTTALHDQTWQQVFLTSNIDKNISADRMYTSNEITAVLGTGDENKYLAAIMRAPHLRRAFQRYLKLRSMDQRLDFLTLTRSKTVISLTHLNDFYYQEATRPNSCFTQLLSDLKRLLRMLQAATPCTTENLHVLNDERCRLVDIIRSQCHTSLEQCTTDFLSSNAFHQAVRHHNRIALGSPECCQFCGFKKLPLETKPNSIVYAWKCTTNSCCRDERQEFRDSKLVDCR